MNILESLYYFGFVQKKQYSLKHRKRLPARVISIGNLTVGGTGKTPAVISVANEAKKRGFLPVILTRGYKGTAQGPCFVTEGEGPLLSPTEAGDEPFHMAEKLSGVPIIKGKDRYESGSFAIKMLTEKKHPLVSSITFLLDDGFQHWGLFRDKDVVLIDSQAPFGNGRLLPLGRLREPLSELSRAQIIVFSKVQANENRESNNIRRLLDITKNINPRAKIFLARHSISSLRNLKGEKFPPGFLSGKKVYSFCGIGNPASFRSTILSLEANLTGETIFGDHHDYGPSDIARIQDASLKSGAEWIVTTGKDIMKTRNFSLPENLLIIDIEFSAESGLYEEIFRFQA